MFSKSNKKKKKRGGKLNMVEENDVIQDYKIIKRVGRKFHINGISVRNLLREESKSSYVWKLVAKSQNIKDLENINVTTKLIVTR